VLPVVVMNNRKQFMTNIFFILLGNLGLYYFYTDKVVLAYIQLITGLLSIYLMYQYQVHSNEYEYTFNSQIGISSILIVNMVLWLDIIYHNYQSIDMLLTKG
jgi:hypothetical protein